MTLAFSANINEVIKNIFLTKQSDNMGFYKWAYFVMLFLFVIQVGTVSCADSKIQKDESGDEENGLGPLDEDAYAFPGAQGGGMNATGGRGGKVYIVTSLDDGNQPGTLRYAVEQKGPRIIVFNVSGTIYLKSDLRIKNNDLTIAGQTAPGDGICIAHYPVSVSANNVIMRYLRFRMGDESILGTAESDGADALGGRQIENIIVDHCSISWCTDECASFYDTKDFTMQWCIISESLRLSGHSKGPHGYGAIWGGVNASFHHNLMAHHDSRTPRFGSGVKYQGKERTDMRNNVIYNWSGNGCYGGAAMHINIVNNYYKPGPATDPKVANRVMAIDISTTDGDFSPIKGVLGKYYITGNVFPAGHHLTGEAAAAVTRDNWNGIRNNTGADFSKLKITSPVEVDAVTTHSAEKAYELVLLYAGCSLKRDVVDTRIVDETTRGTARFIGKNEHNGLGTVKYPDGTEINWKSENYPKQGLIDSQRDLKPENALESWSAWPMLQAAAALTDSDHDGMPDEWEIAHGLNPKKYDANERSLSKAYDNIEVYINSLVEEMTLAQY